MEAFFLRLPHHSYKYSQQILEQSSANVLTKCASTSGRGGLLWCSPDARLQAMLSRGLAWYIIWNMWSSRCKELKEQTDLESQRSWRPVPATSVCQHVCLVPFLPFLLSFLCVPSHIRWQKQADKFNTHTHAWFRMEVNVGINLKKNSSHWGKQELKGKDKRHLWSFFAFSQ